MRARERRGGRREYEKERKGVREKRGRKGKGREKRRVGVEGVMTRGRRKREEKKKGKGLFWAWLIGVFSTECELGPKKIFPPRADASGAGKNAPLGHSPLLEVIFLIVHLVLFGLLVIQQKALKLLCLLT